MDITAYIPAGKGKAISTADLCRATGLSQREVCKQVELARIQGNVILSCPAGGYWLPSLEEPDVTGQVAQFIRFMTAKNTFATTASAKRFLKELENKDQLAME